MNDFIFSLNAVLPIFLIMSAGYLLSRLKVFTPPFVEKANNVCFTVFLPVLLFYNISSADFKTAFDLKTLLFGVGGTTLLCVLMSAIVPLIIKENPRRGVIIQALFRSNFLLLGVPLCSRLTGAAGTQAASLMTAFVIPTFNLLATVVLARYSFNEKPKAGAVTKKVLLNPLIIASVSGLAFSLAGIRLPAVVNSAVSDVAAIATPLALLMLGAGFEFKAVPRNARALTVVLFLKLLVFPALMLSLAAFAGFDKTGYAVLLCVFATPIAVSSYVMAVREKADGELAGQLVVISSAVSAVTMFLLVYVSRLFGLL